LDGNHLYSEIKALPKIELHRHLEGSLRLDTMVEIAREHGIEMPEYEVETLRPFVQVMPDEYRSDKTFLAKFKTIRQFLLNADVVHRVAYEAVADAAHDNIKYFELRFTPKALCNISKCKPEYIVGVVSDAVAEAAEEYGITARLIVSINRNEGLEIGEEGLDAAIAHMKDGVVGFDMGGDEASFPASPFRDLFRRARDAGLRITLHAGEWEGAQSVWDAVGNLGAERVGHGIRVLEDPGIVNVLLGRGTVLECCPTSNVDSGVVKDLTEHPFPELVRQGLKTTLNTDDPLLSNITLTEELVRAVRYMGLTIDDLKHHTMVAARCAFLPEDERDQLVQQFDQWLYPDVSARSRVENASS
jgi:adenosine deaminase